jgi:hypothetical protein
MNCEAGGHGGARAAVAQPRLIVDLVQAIVARSE